MSDRADFYWGVLFALAILIVVPVLSSCAPVYCDGVRFGLTLCTPRGQ